jgi:4-amino-4-deoxychorismate lyase
MTVLVDGQAPTLDPRDRGLAYGDGVFRTLRCQGGRLLGWSRHYAKLAADCAVLGLACPDEAHWRADLARLAPVDAAVKLVVTRGVSGRGYACAPGAPVSRIVTISPLPVYPADWIDRGVRLRRCDWPLSHQPRLAGVKHLNRLDQVMARREWNDPEIFDGLMCDPLGRVVEGVMSNLFILQDGQWFTPRLDETGVAGVMRGAVIEVLQEMGHPVTEARLDLAAVFSAEAVAVCNSLAGLLPVRALEDRVWADLVPLHALRASVEVLMNEEAVACLDTE